jgi:glycosyltransferase involved in cell wall biosynthesis
VKIAIDLRPLQIGHQYRGIGAYITNVLGRFPAGSSEHTYIIVRYSESNPVEDFDLPFSGYSEVILKKPNEVHGFAKLKQLVLRQFKRRFGNLSAHRPDVFFQPDFQLGLPRDWRMKKYVVMYDIIPLVLKDLYLPSWRQLLARPGLGKIHRLRVVLGAWLKEGHYKRSLRALRRADRIFSISGATADDLHNRLGIPKKKIKTIYLAPSVSLLKPTEKDRPKQLPKSGRPFLLYMGGVDGRRKLADLVHAFNLLNGRGHDFDLVLGGKELAKVTEIPNVEVREAIMDSSYKDQIFLMGYTSQEEKAWLMKNAFVFVYPTLYEGFGLPVLEAMLQGCPAITYGNSSLPEIVGDAAVLLDEQDGTAIRDAVLNLQKNPKQRQRLIKEGQEQAKSFSWEKTAAATFDVLVSK